MAITQINDAGGFKRNSFHCLGIRRRNQDSKNTNFSIFSEQLGMIRASIRFSPKDNLSMLVNAGNCFKKEIIGEKS